MKKIIIVTYIFLCGFTLNNTFHTYPKEPDFAQYVGWNLTEVPGNIAIYYDLDLNGEWDIIFAHAIVGQFSGPKCAEHLGDKDKRFIIGDCKEADSVNYVLLKEPTMYRFRSQQWQTVLQKTSDWIKR